MNEEKIRFRLRFRYHLTNAIEAEVVAEVLWEDRSDVQYEGRPRMCEESAAIACRPFPYEGRMWGNGFEDAKKAAREWAAKGLAKALGSFF